MRGPMPVSSRIAWALSLHLLAACSSGRVSSGTPPPVRSPDAEAGTLGADGATEMPPAMRDGAVPDSAVPDASGRDDSGAHFDASTPRDGDLLADAASPDAAIQPPPPNPRIVAAPLPGTFATSIDVTLSLVEVDPSTPLTLWCTRDGSLPIAGVSPLCSTMSLTSSTGVRAIAADAAGIAQLSFFGAYLKLDADVATFSSSLPLLVFWSTQPVPESKVDAFTSFSMSVFDASSPLRNQWPGSASSSMRAGIKIRGSSSADFPKRPWRVETWSAISDDDEESPLLGMPSESDWALNAPLNYDRALMRNSLAFAFSNAIGRYAPRTRFAEVFVVGNAEAVGLDDYEGVYEVTELIKRDAERVAMKNLKPTDITAPALTGGYLFKEDRLGPGESGFTAGTAGGAFDFESPFVYDDPDEADLVPVQRDYLTQYLNDVGSALAAPNHVDPRTGLAYGALIDVGAFIDHHIVNVFTKNPDAFRLSGYFHKDRSGLLVAGPVWDFDRTMGCNQDDRAGDPTWWDPSNQTTDTTRVFDHGFYRGLFADPAFRTAYWARLSELLNGPLAPAPVTAMIDENAALLSEAAVRNFARWSAYPPRGSFSAEVTLLKAWLTERRAWMIECLKLPDPRTCQGQ